MKVIGSVGSSGLALATLLSLAMATTVVGPTYASKPTPDPSPWVGCYDVSLGSWQPTVNLGSELQYIAPSGGLKLLSKRLSKRGAPFPAMRQVEPAVDPKHSAYDTNYWQLLDDDSIQVTWTNGFSSLTMLVRPSGQDLRGTAETYWDRGGEKQTADVVLKRIQCGKPSA